MRRCGAALVLGALIAPAMAAGQATTICSIKSDHYTQATAPNGQSVEYLGGNILIRCPARSITLTSDSAERYADRDYLIGHVHYDEPRLSMTSDFLTYFSIQDRVLATGHVNAKLPTGSTLVGPQAEYLRETPARPRKQMIAVGRPTITVVEKDSVGKPDSVTVIANRVFMDGDSLVYASGQVNIARPEITATGDSAALDSGRETMRLMRNPEVNGKRDRPFRLTGDLIDSYSANRKLNRVIARAHARAVSGDMTLTSDTIDLRVANDKLSRAIAWGKSRAHAVSPTQNMTADSIDVDMPGQRVRVVRALRDAYAEGRPDSTKLKPAPPDTMDWLRGDTIIARFDTTAVKDSSQTPPIQQLLAYRHARSLYHLAPSDTTAPSASWNYVSADTIIIRFDKQRVSTVDARGRVMGFYGEAGRDSTLVTATVAPGRGGRGPTQPPSKKAPTSIVPLPPRKP